MSDARPLRIGISTCPNDTFTFSGLLSGAVRAEGLELAFELLDIEELNERMLAGQLDVAKISFAAALELSAECVVLPTGSALGFGVGPLLLARQPGLDPASLAPGARVLCPGAHTTASLLFNAFHPGLGQVEQVVFSEIMPALERGEADLGVCIHEGRFTWAERGLGCVEDLGSRWEAKTGAPLPLGGLVARRALGPALLRRIQAAVRASLDYARADPERALPCMRRYAQELADPVIQAHVELYVNDWTTDLGPEGKAALDALWRHAPARGPALTLFSP